VVAEQFAHHARIAFSIAASATTLPPSSAALAISVAVSGLSAVRSTSNAFRDRFGTFARWVACAAAWCGDCSGLGVRSEHAQMAST